MPKKIEQVENLEGDLIISDLVEVISYSRQELSDEEAVELQNDVRELFKKWFVVNDG